MKVVRDTGKIQSHFGALSVGDSFEYSECIYIKAEEMRCHHRSDCYSPNAVNLSNGTVGYFDSNISVFLVNCHKVVPDQMES